MYHKGEIAAPAKDTAISDRLFLGYPLIASPLFYLYYSRATRFVKSISAGAELPPSGEVRCLFRYPNLSNFKSKGRKEVIRSHTKPQHPQNLGTQPFTASFCPNESANKKSIGK